MNRRQFQPEEPNANPQNFQESTSTSKGINVLVYICLFILVFVVGLFLFWRFQGNDVLEVKNDPVPVRTIRPRTTADGVVFLTVDYCKKVRATGTVRTSVVSDTREYFFPVSTDTQDPVCKKIEFPTPIPHEVLPGWYHVHFRISYKVNPIKTVVEEFDSQPFKVELINKE